MSHRLYLDTEFNGFGGQLISLALASPTGDNFYEAVPLPRAEILHPWVAEHVVPFIHREPISWHLFRSRLASYLRKHNDADVYAD